MSHPVDQRQLGEILVGNGLVEKKTVDAVLKSGEGRIGQRLVKQKAITSEQLAETLASQYELTYVRLDKYTISPELFSLIPATQAYQLGLVPYHRYGNSLQIATSDPLDWKTIDKLERDTGLTIEIVVSTPEAIKATLKRSEGSAEILKNISEDFRLVMVKESEDGNEETVSLENLGEKERPVIKLVNSILLDGLQKRASDIHIETYEAEISVKYRIDGVLYAATEQLDRQHHGALVSRLKIMAELDIAEKRVPQDGRFRLRQNGKNIDFRVSILPSVFGEDVVIRVLDKSTIIDGVQDLSLGGLGISDDVLTRFRKNVHEPYGMVLITGPTGSGKTTTLYAALKELNSAEEKIITIEDPVEYQIDGIVQIPVNEKKKLTFARGLRSILRHDPDKIMVGEIRDSETVQIAVQSALTGHLVFTTVHANNAFDVIGRFSHMGVDVYNFVSALNCVMAQRLVRKICLHCKQQTVADRELLILSGLDTGQYAGHVWHEGMGCSHCSGTGYRGRAAITEFLELSPRIRELIIEKRPASELQQVAIGEGMITLRQSALAMALAGETTLREINRVTFVD